jgi:alpha-methylacyl-CoA racemase
MAPEEAAQHPHNIERGTFTNVGGHPQPAPAPRFSVDAPSVPGLSPTEGSEVDGFLRAAGVTDGEIASLRAEGALG